MSSKYLNTFLFPFLSKTFCLISFFTSKSTIFQLCRDRSSWVEPVLSKDKCVLLKDTSDAGEAQTRGPLVSSQALYNSAAVLPEICLSDERLLLSKMLVIRAGTHKMLARKAIKKTLIRQLLHENFDLGLCYLSMLSWQGTYV